jgi:hypothetical protein
MFLNQATEQDMNVPTVPGCWGVSEWRAFSRGVRAEVLAILNEHFVGDVPSPTSEALAAGRSIGLVPN